MSDNEHSQRLKRGQYQQQYNVMNTRQSENYDINTPNYELYEPVWRGETSGSRIEIMDTESQSLHDPLNQQ